MKRFCIFLAGLICIGCLGFGVQAATGASTVQSSAAVSSNGSCQVSLVIVFRLEKTLDELQYPVPSEAKDILLNGTAAQTSQTASAIWVDIPLTAAGEYTMQLQYTLTNVLQTRGGKLYLTLPLLSGFSYPITSMEFTVTLPGNVSAIPTFSSAYYQENIESSLISTVTGNTVSGFLQESLKDHETLTMTLEVPTEQFPGSVTRSARFSPWDGAALVLLFLAIVYYCLTLLPRFPKRTRCFTAPDGISAGEVGTCLTGRGTDLTLMVITWAQLGYILIELDDNGRVQLHRRMDMGNERSNFEIRCFQSLFGKRQTVDGTGYHYARLCRKISAKSPILRQLFRPNSGNPLLFRVLCCIIGGCNGVSMAIACANNTGLQIVLGIVFGILCGIAAWWIQSGTQCLPLRDRTPLLIGTTIGLIWLAIGIFTSGLIAVLPAVLFQFLAGFAIAFGGRRSELGARCLSQLLSLKRYMRSASNFDLQRLLQTNPNYFYELAPYALAMGVDKTFARRFGKTELPECSYLVTDMRHPQTPTEFAARLREAADALDARQKRLAYERFIGK